MVMVLAGEDDKAAGRVVKGLASEACRGVSPSFNIAFLYYIEGKVPKSELT